VLLRNSNTGKIIMVGQFLTLSDNCADQTSKNFKIYSGLKPTQTKAALSFVGHDNGVSQTYSVRVATENEAKQLKEMFDREIAFVKAKEES
jgi:nucleoporin NUP2